MVMSVGAGVGAAGIKVGGCGGGSGVGMHACVGSVGVDRDVVNVGS